MGFEPAPAVEPTPVDPVIPVDQAPPVDERTALVTNLRQMVRQKQIAELRHHVLLTNQSPEVRARRNQAFDEADREAMARARATGQPLTPPLVEAHRAAGRRMKGLPTAEEYSRDEMVRGITDPNRNPIAHGGQGFGLTAVTGVESLFRSHSADEQEAAQMVAEARAAEAAKMSPVGRGLSHATELGANVASLAVPGLGPANAGTKIATKGVPLATKLLLATGTQAPKAGILGATMTVPIEAEGIQAGMSPTMAMVRAVGQTAVMDAVGGMKVPGLGPTAITSRKALPQAVATSTAKAAGAGAIKGAVMTAGQQTLDAVSEQIDAATPQAEAHTGAAMLDFALMDAAFGGRAAGRSARKVGQQARERLPVARENLRTFQPNPDVQAAWQQNPGEAASLQRGAAGLDMQMRQNVARQQEQGLRPAADPMEQLRAQEAGEPDTRAAEARQERSDAQTVTQESVERFRAAKLEQEARLRLDQGEAKRDEHLATALELTREQEALDRSEQIAREHEAELQRANPPVEAEVTLPERTPEEARSDLGRDLAQRREAKRYAERPEEAPVPATDAWREDADVMRAQANYDRIMSDPNADRTAKGYARQGLLDAVSTARNRPAPEAPAVDEMPAEATPQLGPGEPVAARTTKPKLTPPSPEAQHNVERQQILADLRGGKITKAEAITRTNQSAAKLKEPTNAPPAPIPQKESRPQVLQGVPRAREIGVTEAGGERAPAPADQSVRSAEAPVEGGSRRVPEPQAEEVAAPQGLHAEKLAADLAGSEPHKTINPEVVAARAENAVKVEAAQKPEAPGSKRKVFSARTMGETAGRLVRKLKGAFGAFQGNKEKGMPMMTEVTHQTMTPEERAGITHTHDLFGGSGSAGLMHRVLSFPSQGAHVIHEWNEARLEKIRMAQTMTPTQVRAVAERTGVHQLIRDEIAKGSSGGGVSGRIHKMLDAMIDPQTGKLKDPARKEEAAVLALFADHLGRKGVGKTKEIDPKDLWQSLMSGVYSYAAKAHELHEMARVKGIDVEYRQGDSYNAEIQNGKHVHVLMDPPYFATAGYNGTTRVDPGTYDRTRQLLRKLKDNGNHVQYTDEAWWKNKIPTSPEWRDGERIREGDKILGDIHNEVDTFDTHRVGDRVESIATIHPGKEHSPRQADLEAPKSAEVRVDGDSPRPAKEKKGAEKATGAPANHSVWAENVRQGLEGGLEGKEYAGQKTGAPIPGVKLNRVSDREYELVGPDGKAGTRVFIAEPLRPENVNPESWFTTASAKYRTDGVQLMLVKAGMSRDAASKIRNASDFATAVPGEIQRKLFAKWQPGGEYKPGQIVIRVSGKGDAQLSIAQNMNHETWHDLFDVFVPQAAKDAALSDMQARGMPGAKDMSADRSKGAAYRSFLEAVQSYNGGWTKERATLSAAQRKMAGETLLGTIKRWANSIGAMLRLVEKAAADTPQGLDLVIERMRKGEYKERQPRAAEAKPAEGEKPAYNIGEDLLAEEAKGRERAVGRLQPLSEVKGDRSSAIHELVNKARNDAHAEHYRNIDATEARAEETLKSQFNGDPVAATKNILHKGRMDSPEEMHLLMKAMDATSEGKWSADNGKLLTKMADVLSRSRSFWGQMLSHGQRVNSPARRLAQIRMAVLAPSRSSQYALDKLDAKILKARELPGEMEGLRAERDRTMNAVVEQNTAFIKTIKDKYGIDLADPASVNYTLDAGMARDLMTLVTRERKGVRLDAKLRNMLRGAMLSDFIQTQTQQFTSNLSMLATLRNPLAMAVSGGRAGAFASLAAGKSALRTLTGRKYGVLIDAHRNGLDSFQGRTQADREAGKAWGPARNIHVDETINVGLGRMDEMDRAHPGESTGPLLSPLSFISSRPMAYLDGMSQRLSSRIMEAQLYYEDVIKAGGTHAEARREAQGVIDGAVDVPVSMQVEAIHRSLDSTFQDLAIAQPGKEGSKYDTRAGVNALLQMQRWLDHAFPLNPFSKPNAAGEQAFLPVGSALMPFIRTPAAVARMAVRLMPPAQLAYMGVRKAVGRYEGEQGKYEKARDLSYLTMGTLFASGVVGAMATGAAQVMGTESDETRKRLINAGEIKDALPEYTMQIMGHRMNYSRLEPLATVTAAIANAVNEVTKGGNIAQATASSAKAYYRIGAGLAFFGALDDVRSIFETPRGYNTEAQPDSMDKASAFLADKLMMLYPAIVRGASQDEIRHQFPEIKGMSPESLTPEGAKDAVEKIMKYLAARTGISKTPPKYTMEGKEIKEGSLFGDAKGGITEDPVGLLGQKLTRGGFGKLPSRQNESQSLKAIDDYRQSLPADLKAKLKLPYFSRDFSFQKQKYHLSPKEYAELQREGGEYQEEGLAQIADVIGELDKDEATVTRVNNELEKLNRKIENGVRKILLSRRADVGVTPAE